MTIPAASLAKADARFAETNLLRLSDDMMPHVLEAMVLKARTAKIAINKLTDKQIADAIHTAREALIEATDDQMIEAREEAAEVSDATPIPGLPGVTVGRVKVLAPKPRIEVVKDDEKGVTLVGPRAKKVREVKQIHTSHEGCSHASTKVARAACRRARARKA